MRISDGPSEHYIVRNGTIPEFAHSITRGHAFTNFLDGSSHQGSGIDNNSASEDRFLRGRQIAYLIYEYFRVTGANDSVENCADLFTLGLRNDDIQEFDSKWDGIFIVYDENPI